MHSGRGETRPVVGICCHPRYPRFAPTSEGACAGCTLDPLCPYPYPSRITCIQVLIHTVRSTSTALSGAVKHGQGAQLGSPTSAESRPGSQRSVSPFLVAPSPSKCNVESGSRRDGVIGLNRLKMRTRALLKTSADRGFREGVPGGVLSTYSAFRTYPEYLSRVDRARDRSLCRVTSVPWALARGSGCEDQGRALVCTTAAAVARPYEAGKGQSPWALRRSLAACPRFGCPWEKSELMGLVCLSLASRDLDRPARHHMKERRGNSSESNRLLHRLTRHASCPGVFSQDASYRVAHIG